MRRRILLLNLLLVALTAAAAWQLRREYLAAQTREQAELAKRVRPLPPAPAAAPRIEAPVTALNYGEIAQKMLFSKDRNPNVVVEIAPPPPPKPMPPLPIFRGVMNLGDGPIAILSEKPNTPTREFRVGQQVGEFKLVAVNNRDIVLEWEGKQVTKQVEELTLRDDGKQEAAAARTEAPATAGAAAGPVQSGPGVEIGGGIRACLPNDSTPAGTVVDGMRKVVSESPFGKVCRWQPLR